MIIFFGQGIFSSSPGALFHRDETLAAPIFPFSEEEFGFGEEVNGGKYNMSFATTTKNDGSFLQAMCQINSFGELFLRIL